MSTAMRTLFFVPFLWITVEAYSTFETNCTAPSTYPINFVSSPNSRGTLDILWGCLFTIFACTWTIQHLNVPEQRPAKIKKGAVHGLWCDFKWGLKGFWSNLKWMLITMVAPEYILGKAIGDFVSAWRMRKQMKDFASTDGVEWDLAHGFYANMGGFVAFEKDTSTTRANVETERQGLEDTTVRVEELKAENTGAPIQPAKDTFSLTAEIIYQLRTHANIDKLPDITTAEIHDKSKSSIFVKAIAVVQVFWVSVQVIVRASKGLAVSQLELAVTGFSVCAVITYVLLIPRPQGVQVPSRPIKCKPGSVSSLNDFEFFLRELLVPGLNMDTSTDSLVRHRKQIPNDMIHSDRWLLNVYLGGIYLGGGIFGSIHVAGWNLNFPTPIEQKLWRIASVLMTCLLPAAFAPFVLYTTDINLFKVLGDEPWTTGMQIWGFVFGILYIAARLFTLVEIFRSLLFLPPDAFISTWATNIPHVG